MNFPVLKRLIASYSPQITYLLVYMLQASEYQARPYLTWVFRTIDFSTVMKRRTLVKTPKAQLLLVWSMVAYGGLIALAVWYAVKGGMAIAVGLAVVAVLPYGVALLLIVPLALGYVFIQRPKEKRILQDALRRLQHHRGLRVAIAGSYGKTTFKETLATILSEKLHVAASPGNMNTPLGISRFIQKLDGSEDVLIFELGEEHPGDVMRLCELTHPKMGVITGISEAHLSSFGSIDAIVKTIFELDEYLKGRDVYKNGDSGHVVSHTSPKDRHVYSEQGVNGWKVRDSTVGLEGTSFTATKKGKTIWAHSRLLGRHQVGPLVACIDIADKLGMSPSEIAEGITHTQPFEHRMQPFNLNGATIIDDTYNGNLKGVEAGLAFMATIQAKRKVFVTPGLVEQGSETERIHQLIGERAAHTVDKIILMQNSTTTSILQGVHKAQFSGEVAIIDDPLAFYTNLGHFVAAGDVVLMQNDWTDNYA